MARRPLLLTWNIALAFSLLACGEPSTPSRTGHDESSVNRRHEAFKRGLRSATESMSEDVDRAHAKVKQGVKHAGEKLGVRRELLGGKASDAGAPKP
jgi:hypothetical protein